MQTGAVSSLGEQFMQSKGRPVDLDGQRVHMAFDMGPLPAGTLRIRMDSRRNLRQGMAVKSDGGRMHVAKHTGELFAFWSDTAPDCVEVELTPLRGHKDMGVRVWNIWTSQRWGNTDAWIGNAGLLIETADPYHAVLRASAGPGDPSFDDLVATLDFVPK